MGTINPNMVPASGYEYQNPDGAKLVGNSWGGLAKKVREYRARLGQPPGDPRAEILAQACERNPSLCIFSRTHPVQADEVTKLKVRRLTWLTALRKKKDENQEIEFVNEAEATARVEVCAHCPHNKQVSTGCGACVAALKSLRNTILGDRRQFERVNACNALGTDLVTAVHLDEVRVNVLSLPANCWRKVAL